MEFLMELSETEKSEAGGKANGLRHQLQQFDNFFVLRLLFHVLSRAETVNTAIQKNTLNLYQSQLMLQSLKDSVSGMRIDFDSFWQNSVEEARVLDLDEPKLPRPRKLPRRNDDGPASHHVFATVEDMYRQRYFEIVDTMKAGLDERFSSAVFEHMTDIEKFVVGQTDGESVVRFYNEDFDADRLRLHRDMFTDIARQRNVELTSFQTALDLLRGESEGTLKVAELLPELSKLFRLALTIPVTSCTSERSFSSLRRMKTYLRSTMSQQRLNHVAILHSHKNMCQELDLNDIADEFIHRTAVRRNTFQL
jgi:hypothetical protein